MVTAGPWKPVYLDIYDARVDDVYVISNLAPEHSMVELAIDVRVVGSSATTARVAVLDNAMQQVCSNPSNEYAAAG